MTTIVLDGRHIQDRFPGIGRYVFNLASGLARVAVNEQVRLVVNPGFKNSRFDISLLESYPQVEGIKVGAPVWSFGEQLLGLDKRLVRKAALWHSAYYLMPYWLPIPSVVTLEDILPLIVRESMPLAVNRLIYRSLNMLAATRAAHVLTLSHAAAADIQRVLRVPEGKITVTALAADKTFYPRPAGEVEHLRAKLNLPARYALYVGSNKPHKNLVRLIEAWGRTTANGLLVIAGHWDSRFPEAKQLAHRSGLAERVVFRENLSGEDIPTLMTGAEVFVFPSLYEGFGLPPLEAMACGVPVACSHSSSLTEVVGDAALLFDPSDAQDIASKLTNILEDKALEDSLRGRGLARAASFSWDDTARKTLEVYKSVVGGQQ